MARIKKNIIMHGLTGTLNKELMLKHYGTNTVISSYPDMSKVVKSENQKAENHKFREAIAYARSQMADPVAKAEYKAKAKGLQNAQNVAIADFYHPPVIKSIDTTAFHGRKNNMLTIHAIDDFKVVSVTVDLMDGNYALLETGDARPINKHKWEYKLQNTYETNTDYIILAKAWDKPGNKAEKEVRISPE
jgi:hypothetical protein